MAPPKGRTNNPAGRPTIGDEKRVLISLRIDPVTLTAIDEEVRRTATSRGLVVDDLVARCLMKRRRRN